MTIRKLRPDLRLILKSYQLESVYDAKVELLNGNPQHPGLNFELVQATKKLKDTYRHYSFRLTKGYRAYGFKPKPNELEVFAIDKHKYGK